MYTGMPPSVWREIKCCRYPWVVSISWTSSLPNKECTHPNHGLFRRMMREALPANCLLNPVRHHSISCFKISVQSNPFALPARTWWAQCVPSWTRTNSHKTSTGKLVSSSSLCCLFAPQSQLPACTKTSPSSVNLKTMLLWRSRKGNYRMNNWPSLTCFVCLCLQGQNLYFLSCLGKYAWPYLFLWSVVDLAKKKTWSWVFWKL